MIARLFAVACLALAAPALGQAIPGIADPAPQENTGEASEPAAEIGLQSRDSEIAERLSGILGELDGLEQVEAEVRDGVVTLRGLALSEADRQRAEAVAGRVAGVVSVENDIEIERRVSRRLQPIVEKTDELIRDTVAFLPLLLLGLIVLSLFWMVGWLLTRSGGLLGKLAPNPLVQTLAGQIIRLLFILVGLVVAMRLMGATALVGSILGAAGVVGLALGFAVRDTIENYIASILLSIRRPFLPNDLVIIEGLEGRVTRLNSRATFLTSLDGNELRIPNAIVYKAKITNFSRIPERRFEFLVGIGYENDLCTALATAYSAVKSAEGVLAKPEPDILVESLDESTIALKVLGWVDQSTSDFAKVRSAAIRAVKAAFDEKSISMPAPTYNIASVENGDTVSARTVSDAAVNEVTSTRADRTIESKVRELRSEGDEDLLTSAAPRE